MSLFQAGLLLLLSAAAGFCETPTVLHPRVGDTIDAAERDYFRLFPSIRSFREAQIFATDSGAVWLAITEDTDSGAAQRQFRLSAEDIAALRSYLGNYETLRDNNIAVDPRIVSMVSPFAPEYGEGRKSSVITTSGVRKNGRLFCATDLAVILAPSPGSYDWRHTNGYTVLGATEIRTIRCSGYSLWKTTLLCAGIGAASGAILGLASTSESDFFSPGWAALISGITGFALGSLTGVIVSALSPPEDFRINGSPVRYTNYRSQLSAFSKYNLPPPEFTGLQVAHNPASAISEHQPQAETTVPTPDDTPLFHSTGRVHIFASLPLGTSNAPEDMGEAYRRAGFGGRVSGFLGTLDYPLSYANGGYWSFQAEYSISPRVHLGAHWSDLRGADVTGIDNESEEISGETYGVIVKYIFHPASIPGDRFEFAGAAGLDWNLAHGTGNLGTFYNPYVRSLHPYSFHKNGAGVRIELSFDVFLARYLSLQAKLGGAWMGDVNVSEQTSTVGAVSRTLPAHAINLSREYFTVGLGLHI